MNRISVSVADGPPLPAIHDPPSPGTAEKRPGFADIILSDP